MNKFYEEGPLEPWEALDQAIKPIGVKGYARFIKKSTQWVYVLCWPPENNGKRNFIYKVRKILNENMNRSMKVKPILECICEPWGFEVVEATVKKREVVDPKGPTLPGMEVIQK